MLEPLKWFVDESDFRFYLINCGSGLMHLIIFPDNTVMLFDCNVTNENEEEIINFLDRHIPAKYDKDAKKEEKFIDIFVNSHRDEDHYRGLKKINEKFKIKSIWDSGQSGENTDSADYNYYMYLRRELKKKSEDNLIVPTPSNAILKIIDTVDIYCLAAEADFIYQDESKILEHAAKIQHTNSMVLLMVYSGRKLLLTGDSDWKSWKEQIVSNFTEIVPNYENVDILIASHHGSRSFFTDEETIDLEKYPDTTYIESIELINPIITLISCGDYNTYHHPNKEAMKLYEKYTSEGRDQIHTTHEKGNLCGYIDEDGNFGVIPERFKNRMPFGDRKFYLKAHKKVNDEWIEIKSGEKINVNTSVKFSLIGIGDVLNSHDSINIWWEVCNNGIDEYCEHKEVYKKEKSENDDRCSFSREVVYKGKHLLRCRVKNSTKHFDGTVVFLVEGV